MLDNRVKTFIKVIDKGSFALAAKELFISPVSIKKQMDSLEKELGIQLLERTNRGVRPTAAGEIYHNSACRIEQLSQATLAQMRELSTSHKPTIRVGTSLLRPCSRFLDIWTRTGSSDEFSIEIVPFDDGEELDRVIANLGNQIDCFIGPCDAPHWFDLCNVLKLGFYDCAIAVPRQHSLAAKSSITWKDLSDESLMLVKKGASPVIDSIRSEIDARHPDITIIDAPYFYSISTFNQGEREGFLMETLDVWKDIHPGFVTLPMEWQYQIPYGLFYSKHSSDKMNRFIDFLTQG